MYPPEALSSFPPVGTPRGGGPEILGLHHVTATVGRAQPDLDHHGGHLGLRLVKKTVNFDNPGVYHFYYGNEVGAPSTLMTTFPYAGHGVDQGRIGAGQVVETRYAVPRGALPWWRTRLAEAGHLEEGEAGEAGVLPFRDPSGLRYALVEEGPPPGVENPASARWSDDRTPWVGDNPGAPSAEKAIRGLHSVLLLVRDLDASATFARELLGLAECLREPGRVLLAPPAPSGGEGYAMPGALLELRQAHPDDPDGVNGIGTVHHVALAVADAGVQQALRARLLAAGVQVTEVRDRQYFRSIYFREPGGVLYEVATVGPGFLVDEPRESLGTTLRLPPWQEANRRAIEARLEAVRHPARRSEASPPSSTPHTEPMP